MGTVQPTLTIPWQLQNPAFRFYLIGTNSKLPMQKKWNSQNCYQYNHIEMALHQGNYGVACGHGNLIVLDIDNKEFGESYSFTHILPPTFTVLSAGRKLPHYYYILKGEMFKKCNVRDDESNVLMDVQAQGAGVVGPGSTINRRLYTVVRDLPIAEISLEILQREFYIKPNMKRKSLFSKSFPDPDENAPNVLKTLKILQQLGITQCAERMFKCPFHQMKGKGNLSILPNTGALYCFHELKYWRDVHDFINEYNKEKE